jgi:hypothetical protein
MFKQGMPTVRFTAKEYHECRWLGRGDRFLLGFWIFGDREENRLKILPFFVAKQ